MKVIDTLLYRQVIYYKYDIDKAVFNEYLGILIKEGSQYFILKNTVFNHFKHFGLEYFTKFNLPKIKIDLTERLYENHFYKVVNKSRIYDIKDQREYDLNELSLTIAIPK